jgi:hypothetical protein
MSQLSRRDLMLLVLLTLFWGVNWPVMKLGVAQLPPLYFRSICIAGGRRFASGAGCAAGSARRGPTILKLALPNVIVWHLLAIVAIKMLFRRAAILGNDAGLGRRVRAAVQRTARRDTGHVLAAASACAAFASTPPAGGRPA